MTVDHVLCFHLTSVVLPGFIVDDHLYPKWPFLVLGSAIDSFQIGLLSCQYTVSAKEIDIRDPNLRRHETSLRPAYAAG